MSTEKEWVKKKSIMKDLIGFYVVLSDSFTIERRGGSSRSRELCAKIKNLELSLGEKYALIAIKQDSGGGNIVVLGVELGRIVEIPWSEHLFERDPDNAKVSNFDDWVTLNGGVTATEPVTPTKPTKTAVHAATDQTKLCVGGTLIVPSLEELFGKFDDWLAVEAAVRPKGKRGQPANLCGRSFRITSIADGAVTVKNTAGKMYTLPAWLCGACDTAVKKPKTIAVATVTQDMPISFLPAVAVPARTAADMQDLVGKLVLVRNAESIHGDYPMKPVIALRKVFGAFEEHIALLVDFNAEKVGHECGLIFPSIGVEVRLPFCSFAIVALTRVRLDGVLNKHAGYILDQLSLQPGEAVQAKTPGGTYSIVRDGARLIKL
ncbi:MAG: hypothetical protein LBL84_03180 [Candidatus Nomurabacteria bacterium]|jgi:hypothetical protein|nr:hypothetical protein [Candidatus Nomurabacteria bacterium]